MILETKKVRIENIDTTRNIRKINASHLESLINGEYPIPPIDVEDRYPGKYLLLEGQHRVEALKRLGHEYIDANIHKFESEDERLDFQYESNLHHGMTLSKKEKADYAMRLYRQGRTWNYIGKKLGMHHATVKKMLDEMLTKENQEQDQEPGTDTVKKGSGEKVVKSLGVLCQQLMSYDNPQDFVLDLVKNYNQDKYFSSDPNMIDVLAMLSELLESSVEALS